MAPVVVNPPSEKSSEVVIIPDIFESWMSRPVVLNPHYDMVESEAIDAIIKYTHAQSKLHARINRYRLCGYTEKQGLRMRKVEIPYFASLIVPDADEVKLRTVTDWVAWVSYRATLFKHEC